MKWLAALLALLFCIDMLGCDPPSQNDPAHYGTVKVYVDPEWLPIDQLLVHEQLHRLNRLGPDFVPAVAGERSISRVAVQPFVSRNCTTDAGHWEVGSRVVELDRSCFTSESTFSQAVGHEIGHALGMRHVCYARDDAIDCSPVGYGPAMMNPVIMESDGPGFNEAWGPALGEMDPTPLDLAEFRRVY